MFTTPTTLSGTPSYTGIRVWAPRRTVSITWAGGVRNSRAAMRSRGTMHSPTVRVRQLAAEPGGDQYAALLRELFDLDVPLATQADAVPQIGEKA